MATIASANVAYLSGERPMGSLMLQYSYLQFLDFLTTVAFLLTGVREANPLVKLAMYLTPNAVGGLLLVKMLGVLLGLYCWRMGRTRLLRRMNWMFAGVVTWNLVAIIISLGKA